MWIPLTVWSKTELRSQGNNYEEYNREIWVRISLLHVVQTGFGVHPASYPMDTGGSFPGGKVTGA
jgi:hypothetical protein